MQIIISLSVEDVDRNSCRLDPGASVIEKKEESMV